MNKYVSIFCSACKDIDQSFFNATNQIGTWLGQHQKVLIYGGASLGLMECLAKATQHAGGVCIGVVPDCLAEKGAVSKIPEKIIRVKNLSERKDKMLEMADILIALPGGIGTLDEAFHVIASAAIGYHHKQLIFFNQENFYTPLFRSLHEIEALGFGREPFSSYFKVANSLEELFNIINKY